MPDLYQGHFKDSSTFEIRIFTGNPAWEELDLPEQKNLKVLKRGEIRIDAAKALWQQLRRPNTHD